MAVGTYNLARTASALETCILSATRDIVVWVWGTHSNLTRALLVLGVDDLAVVKDHGPATVTVAHTSGPAVVLAEEGLGVAQEQDLVAVDAVDLAPCIHDPGVVGSNGGDHVNALVLELLGLGNVGRQVVCLTAGCEGAGDREDDDFLVCPLLAGVVFLRAAAGGGVTVSNGRPSIHEEWWLAMALGNESTLHQARQLEIATPKSRTYSNLTPSGSLSPTWRGAMLFSIGVVGIVGVVLGQEV